MPMVNIDVNPSAPRFCISVLLEHGLHEDEVRVDGAASVPPWESIMTPAAAPPLGPHHSNVGVCDAAEGPIFGRLRR